MRTAVLAIALLAAPLGACASVAPSDHADLRATPGDFGEATLINGLERAPADQDASRSYGALSAQGGIELDVGTWLPAPNPFPLTVEGLFPPRWAFRAGYTHWWVAGGQSGGATFAFRVLW